MGRFHQWTPEGLMDLGGGFFKYFFTPENRGRFEPILTQMFQLGFETTN